MPLEDTDKSNLGALTISPTQIQANRYELVSRVVDGLAHEVKNPIHAAIINLELLRRRSGDPDTRQLLGRIDLLEQQVTSVHELVDSLFRFLRPDCESAGWIELDDAIGALMPVLRAYCRVARVEIAHEPANGAISAIERAALQQIVLNLVVNAVEAMRPHGGRIELRTVPAGREVHLHVSDTGPGISDAVIPHLGEPGGSTSAGCSGLGLAVCRHLAEEAGGRIELGESESGATVVLTLTSAAGA
jgi:signal transduction histidine kinase